LLNLRIGSSPARITLTLTAASGRLKLVGLIDFQRFESPCSRDGSGRFPAFVCGMSGMLTVAVTAAWP
jgi:hypothetical protein